MDLSPPAPAEPEPLAGTATRYAALLASPLTTSEFSGFPGVDKGRVRRRIGERAHCGVEAGRENRPPASQFM